MDVFLAARWQMKPVLLQHRIELESLGHTVTSCWLDSEVDKTERERFYALRASGDSESNALIGTWAMRDFEDVMRSNCLVWFGPSGRQGGSHAEFGMALALAIRTIVVGAPEHAFHSMPQVERYPDFASLLARFMEEPENGIFRSSVVMRSHRDLL